MINYKEKLKDITTFVFDVDGVLTNGDVLLMPPAEMIRSMNTKDGFAMRFALDQGYNICIISGGTSEPVRERLKYLGIEDAFIGVTDKVKVFNQYITDKDINKENVMYMGDDIPDYQVMLMSGLPCCPIDAVEEIKRIVEYISPYEGGKGCVRDIIEQTLKVQGNWFNG